MICISFLIGFPYNADQNQIQDSKSPTDESNSEPPIYKPLNIGLKRTCAINYSLFDCSNHQVDVCSWGQPGKVYSEGDSRAVKCISTGKRSVVCFTMYHAFAQFKFVQDDMKKLLDQFVSFKFSDNKSQMSTRAQNDTPKYFFDHNDPNDNFPFGNIYEGKTSNGPDSVVDETKLTLDMLKEEAKLSNAKIINKLRCKPFKIHENKLLDMIELLEEKIRKSYSSHIDQVEVEEPKLEKEGKAKKKSKAAKAEVPVRITNDPKKLVENTIKFSGTEFLLDKLMFFRDKINPAKQIEYAGVIVSATDIMSDEIRKSLFPFSVEIKYLQCLPPNDLRLSHIFIRYSLECIFNEETEKVEITEDNEKKLHIDSSKMFFINRLDVPFSLFIEALQTRLFYMEFYGIAPDEQKKIVGDVVSEEPRNSRSKQKTQKSKPPKSKPPTSKKKNVTDKNSANNEDNTRRILLAVAYVNLRDMIRSTLWTDYHVHLTSSIPYESWWNDASHGDERCSMLTERKDINEEPYFKQKELIESGALIKVRFRNGALIQPTLLANCLTHKEILSRIVVIFYDADNSRSVVSELSNIDNSKMMVGKEEERKEGEIMMRSHSSIRRSDSLMSFQAHFSSLKSDDDDANIQDNYISGFAVDTIDKIILMAEGLLNYKFSRILRILEKSKVKKVKILYNSSLAFNKRLYSDPNQRLNTISLMEPVSQIMVLPFNVVKTRVPLPALRAVYKLERMIMCDDIADLCAQNFFPSPEELSALESKFGDLGTVNMNIKRSS